MAYDDLRSGIMITWKASDPKPPVPPKPDTMTTAGICLDSPEGEKSSQCQAMTLQAVLATKSSIQILPDASANFSKLIGETNIALAKLEDIHYSRETFSVAEKLAPNSRQLLRASGTQIGSYIYIDTPANGSCEGLISIVDVLRIASFSDEHVPKFPTAYVVDNFAYYGNDGREMPHGCCGGLVWNDKNGVIGRFRFHVDNSTGLCYSPSLDLLVRLGYKIPER